MATIPINKLLDLSGKTVIITGGAQGIGFGIAQRFAEAGAAVVIADLREKEAEDAALKLIQNSWKSKALTVDVSKESDVQKMVEETISAFDSIDILVNNAGIFPNIPLLNMSPADFDKVIATNLKSVFLCTKKVSEQMITKGKSGKIINITSIDALHPSSVGLAHYDASKHGVWGFTKNAALELAPHHIWVNAIAPGAITTPGVAQAQKNTQSANSTDTNMLSTFLSKIPMKRMGEADDIAKVALFLASDMSSYITGSQIVADGGFLLS